MERTMARHVLTRQYVVTAIAVLAVAGAASGCRKGYQAPTIHVSGKVTYEDGSLVPANRMVVSFLTPQKLIEENYPPAATGQVDTRDGTFSELTTWEAGDGVIAGPHEVEVVRFGDEKDPGGIKAIDYRGGRVWPNKVEVTPEKTEFHITIPRD
jgi:hypothetical protein